MNKALKLFNKPINFYPVIITIFPLVALYIKNMWVVAVYELILAILLILIFMGSLWWLLKRITKSNNKSALIIAVFFTLFFSFGHILPGISNLLFSRGIDLRSEILNNYGRNLHVLFIVWMTIFLFFIYLIRKVHSDFRLIKNFMNVTAVSLIIFVVFNFTQNLFLWRGVIQGSIDNTISPSLKSQEFILKDLPKINELPDIYYIIMDGYGSGDILRKYYGYDNEEFLSYLSKTGFYTNSINHSNYSQTLISLASSLNMKHMDDFAQQVGIHSQNPLPLINLIKKNRLFQFLSDQGYRTIAIQSGFSSTELINADYYLSQNISLTAYQLDLINLTPFSILIRNYPYEIHRTRIRFVFNHLPPHFQTNQPVFVFAHIFAPHPPFVFNKNGDENNPDMIYIPTDGNPFTGISGKDTYINQYRDQLIYINHKLVESIEKILAIPGKESIIIVQGDHGPGSMLDHASLENTNVQERMSILNAYYFPDGDYTKLHPEITPVNTFRVVLDKFLGTNLGLLEDRSYFSLYTSPYDLIDVTEDLNH